MIKFQIFSKPNCMACKMTNNVAQSLHINKDLTVIDPEQDTSLINTLKSKYHVRQMPFVKVLKNGKLIDTWTGFQPDKIKQYRKEA